MLSAISGSGKTHKAVNTRILRQLGAAAALAAILASCGPPQPPSRIGGRVFGVECKPVTLEMQHGETQNIQLADVGGEGKVTGFKVGTVRGDGFIQVSQPAPNNTGWSNLPGAIQIKSLSVDGPTRTVTYYVEILLGGRQGDRIAGGNIWCQVDVKHVAPPTPTFTPTPTPSITPTPTPPVKVSSECKVDIQHGGQEDIRFELPEGFRYWVSRIIGDGKLSVFYIRNGIRVESDAVDGPTRIETYYINLIGGTQEGTSIAGGNIWCQVSVHHVAPTPTPTPTPEYIVTGPPSVITDDNFRVSYTGPLEVPTGGTLAATFEVLTPDGGPAKGELTVTLWASDSDPLARHATEALDPQGKVTVQFEIGDYPDGTILKLLFSHGGKVYELADLTVTP